jgi:DNA-binding NtrC family response regulator
LLVDDEDSLRQPIAQWLVREYGYEVESAAGGLEAIEILTRQKCFDVVLLDYLLPAPYNGLTLMEEIKHRCLDGATAFIIFTGWGLDPQVGVKALKAGAYRYLAKPFDREELAILIQSIVESRRPGPNWKQPRVKKPGWRACLKYHRCQLHLELSKVLELILTMKIGHV